MMQSNKTKEGEKVATVAHNQAGVCLHVSASLFFCLLVVFSVHTEMCIQRCVLMLTCVMEYSPWLMGGEEIRVGWSS